MNNNKVSPSLEERMKQLADKEDLHFLKTLLKFKHKEYDNNQFTNDNNKVNKDINEVTKNDNIDFTYAKEFSQNINQEQQINIFFGNSTISSIHPDIQDSYFEESKIKFELKLHKIPNNSKSQCFNNLNIKQIEELLKQTKKIEEDLQLRPFSNDNKNMIYNSSHKRIIHNEYNFISDKKVSHKTLIRNKKTPLKVNYEEGKKANHRITNTDNEKNKKPCVALFKNNTVKTISTLNRKSKHSIKFINWQIK